jgi:hypothetical protein
MSSDFSLANSEKLFTKVNRQSSYCFLGHRWERQIVTGEKDTRVSISIPKQLFESAVRRIDGTEFKTVDDYVTHVLELVMASLEGREQVYSEEDSRKIRDRLHALGYI